MNMIKLTIKCRLLTLNVGSFIDFKLESCGSVMISTLYGKGTLNLASVLQEFTCTGSKFQVAMDLHKSESLVSVNAAVVIRFEMFIICGKNWWASKHQPTSWLLDHGNSGS